MSKQDEALADLTSAGITERAEAARELGRSGGLEVFESLLEGALGDKSQGVRLACAAAAADVLARVRLAGNAGLGVERRRAVLELLRAIDPGRNAGLFQILACLGDPALVRNLVRGVRDPRVDVRTGALVGLERLACSGLVNGDPGVVSAIRQLLAERRLRPDTCLELGRIAHRTGLWELRPDLDGLSGRLEERWGAALDELLLTFPERLGTEHLLGCWVDRGIDCGEYRQRTSTVAWLIVLPGCLVLGAEDEMVVASWDLQSDGLVSPAFGDAPLPARLLHSWFDGQEGSEVLQIGTRSFGRVPENDLPVLVDLLTLQRFDTAPAGRQLLVVLGDTMSERSAGAYTRAVLHLLAGDHGSARERLETLTASKRVRPEAYWQLATLLSEAGDTTAAVQAAQAYLAAAGSKSPFLAAAQHLVGGGK